jgi:hypothetical protein
MVMLSCFEEDERVMPYPGQVITIPDSIQTYTSYFDLETGQVIHTHSHSVWQLGFECGADGWHILTNSGANWFIYNTEQTILDARLTMPETTRGLFDIQQAFPDSTAVGNWLDFSGNGMVYPQHIYLLGCWNEGTFTRLKQVSFLEVNDTAYRFFFREHLTGFSDTVTMLKADSVNFVYYSFETHSQVYPEPGKTKYDLVFGSYYDRATLFGINIPYRVGGVLQNTWQTRAVLDSVTGYDRIDAATLSRVDFVSQRDIPGYRWKGVTVDLAAGGTASYTVKSNYSYLFQTSTGNFFNLRLLSYSLEGRSGFPRFEYRRLE